MNLPWKKEPTPLEQEMAEVAQLWALAEPKSDEWEMYKRKYLELDARNLEHTKVRSEGAIDAKTWLSTGTTIGLAILTLNYERFDNLRSKVSNLWLRRRN